MSRSDNNRNIPLNAELNKKALEKVGNPNVLINLVSQRVRQLNSGGRTGRPLVEMTPGMGFADVALQELLEDKMGHVVPEHVVTARNTGKKKKKH